MTGSKGILFTATYVDAFHKMDEHIKQQAQLNVPQTPMQALEMMFKAQKTKNSLTNKCNKKSQVFVTLSVSKRKLA